jgi:LDH2 family malate/lactate/ureidoglycolate dehydrogenase
VHELKPKYVEDRVVELLLRWGATPQVARCVGEHLVEAELAGHPSHGLRQLFFYRDQIATGECQVGVEPSITKRSSTLSEIDAQAGLGHPALALAVDAAVGAAAEAGVGVSSVVRCGHAGRMGAWAERGVKDGMITVVFLAASDPPYVMAAGAGSRACLNTNPIALGIPAAGAPLILDIATSVVAAGKVTVAQAHGRNVPVGWIVDSSGVPSEDPADLEAGGAMLPMGGHKGLGLAAMVEALSISFVGADQSGRAPVSGALVVCLPTGMFRLESEVRGSVERLRKRLHDSGPPGLVLAPGEPEAQSRRIGRVQVDEDVLTLLTSQADSS